MAKKGTAQKKQTPSKYVTTRRVARWQREKRRQRITLLSGIVIVAIVLGVIIGGVVATNSSDWLSKIETGSGTVTIKKADYADEMKLYFAGVYDSSTMTKESPLFTLERTALIEDGAKSLGFTVSDAQVTETIRSYFESANESITDDEFQERYQNMLNNAGLSDKKFRQYAKVDLLNQELLSYYLDRIPESGEQVAVETIVVSNESTAYEVAELWRSGLDFETLAELYGDASDSGWLIKGTMEEAFDNVAFSIAIGSISDPVRFDTGSYIIRVLDRKDGPIEEALRQQSGIAEYEKWYYQAYADKVERNPKLDLTEIYDWALKQLQ
ncbi:MAG: SurA N-terminal domain-containing protein [Dehalococcoidia bacterium]|jgi:hypothetical protein